MRDCDRRRDRKSISWSLNFTSSSSLWFEIQRDAIHAMSLVRRRFVAFSLEYMAAMASTFAASDLCSGHTKRSILVPVNSSWDRIEESWPATMRVKLCRALVKRLPTSTTVVDSSFFRMLIFSSTRRLSSFLSKNSKLLRREDSPPFL